MEILRNKIKPDVQKRKLLLFFLCLIFISITSCQKDANGVKLPYVPQKLVIVSFISPQDTIIRVKVTLSQPLYNNSEQTKYQPVENALVTITSELGTGVLIFDALDGYYKLDSTLLKIREGISYTILVNTPDGKSATATTYIPSANTTLDLRTTPDSSLKISWTDPLATVDYYRLFIQQSGYYLYEGNDQSGSFSDTVYSRYVDAQWYPDTESNNGVFTKILPFYYFGDPNVYIYVLHVSKEYYDYSTRLELAGDNNDNPFSEPVPMYSNVTDGFGIFAGYSSFRKKSP